MLSMVQNKQSDISTAFCSTQKWFHKGKENFVRSYGIKEQGLPSYDFFLYEEGITSRENSMIDAERQDQIEYTRNAKRTLWFPQRGHAVGLRHIWQVLQKYSFFVDDHDSCPLWLLTSQNQ